MIRRRIAIGVWCSVLAVGPSTSASAAPSCPTAEQVVDGVYLVGARQAQADRRNGGRTGNSVFLIGDQGITIIDPGPTHKAGRQLRCSIKQRSRLPILALINTHPHPQQVLANGAFPEADIHATTATAETMRSRCAQCQQALEKQIGKKNMTGTEAVLPNQLVSQESTLRIGGREIRLIPLGDAHSHGDLAVLDLASGTLIAGDLANSTHLPELIDGKLDGWIAALNSLLARGDVKRVVPGFGPPSPPGSLTTPLNYLQAVRQIAEHAVAKGEMLAPSSAPATLNRFGGSTRTHSLNLQHAMREAESRWWADAPNPTAQPPAGQAVPDASDTVVTPVPERNTPN